VHLHGIVVVIGMGNKKSANQVGLLCQTVLDRSVVPPLSEVKIMAVIQVQGNPSDTLSHTYLVEVTVNPLLSPLPLFHLTQLAAPVMPHSVVSVRLANLSSESVTLHKG